MKAKFNSWIEQYNLRTLRERGVIALMIVVVVLIAWNELIWSAQSNQYQDQQKQLSTLDSQIETTQLQINVIKTAATQDPNLKVLQQLQDLQTQQQRLDRELTKSMQGLIAPSQMASVLEAVLTQQTDLKLQRLANLPTRSLLETTVSAKNDKQKKKIRGGVYQHGLKIEFTGSYLSTLEYLKALKSLPWHFYWDELALNVQKYPESHIVIKVHTLSLQEGWIGV